MRDNLPGPGLLVLAAPVHDISSALSYRPFQRVKLKHIKVAAEERAKRHADSRGEALIFRGYTVYPYFFAQETLGDRRTQVLQDVRQHIRSGILDCDILFESSHQSGHSDLIAVLKVYFVDNTHRIHCINHFDSFTGILHADASQFVAVRDDDELVDYLWRDLLGVDSSLQAQIDKFPLEDWAYSAYWEEDN